MADTVADLDRLARDGNLVRFWNRDYKSLWASDTDEGTPSAYVADHAGAVLNATVDFVNGQRWSGRVSGQEVVRFDQLLRPIKWPTNPLLDGTVS